MNRLSLIPRPQSILSNAESFILTPDTNIVMDEPNHANAQYLKNCLSPATGYKFLVKQDFIYPGIHLKLQENLIDFGMESYNMVVTSDFVKIEAPMPHGVFNGLQTLLQLLPPEIEFANLLLRDRVVYPRSAHQ